MAKLSKFDETKIKMVMKLRGISREDAMRELHIDATAMQKAEEYDSPADPGYHPMTAKELFGDIGDDDELMPAEEFFKS